MQGSGYGPIWAMPPHFPGLTEENLDARCRDSRTLGRDSNPGPFQIWNSNATFGYVSYYDECYNHVAWDTYPALAAQLRLFTRTYGRTERSLWNNWELLFAVYVFDMLHGAVTVFIKV
jgi:hypothetical protein